jgi:hypothetical protein
VVVIKLYRGKAAYREKQRELSIVTYNKLIKSTVVVCSYLPIAPFKRPSLAVRDFGCLTIEFAFVRVVMPSSGSVSQTPRT